MTNFATLQKMLLADPEIKAEYDRLGPVFAFVGEAKNNLSPAASYRNRGEMDSRLRGNDSKKGS